MNKSKIIYSAILIILLVFIILISLNFISAEFTFQGYTRYENGTNMVDVNVTIEVVQFQEMAPPLTIGTIENVSDSNGYFNLTVNDTYDNDTYMFRPTIIKYNSTSWLAEYMGATIGELRYDDMIMLENSPVKFYLKPAITVDLSAIGIEHKSSQGIEEISNVTLPTDYLLSLEVINESGIQFWGYVNATDCLYILNSTYDINRSFCDLNITNIKDVEHFAQGNIYYLLNATQVEMCILTGPSMNCTTNYSLIDNGNPMLGNYTNVGGIEYVSDLNQFYISAYNGTEHWIDAYNTTFNRLNDENSTNRPDLGQWNPIDLVYKNNYIYELMTVHAEEENTNYTKILRCSVYGNHMCEDTVFFPDNESTGGLNYNLFDNQWYYASITNNSITHISQLWTGRFSFFYQVKDVALGYPIKETFSVGGNGVTSARFSAPADRNYSIMIYPNNGPAFPSRIELNLLSAGNNISLGDRNATIIDNPLYLNLSDANMTTEFVWLSGFARFNLTESAIQNYTNFTITAYLLEAGNMVFQGATLPQNMGQRNYPQVYDTFNTTSGFYNMTLPASVLGANLMLFVSASENSSGDLIYYGGFKEITLTYGETPSETNISLYPLIGEEDDLTIGFEGQEDSSTITTALKEIVIQNSTGTRISQGHLEVELVYPVSQFPGSNITFSWMGDISDDDNGSIKFPLLNYSIKSIQVYSQQYAPKKDSLSISEVQSNPIYYNLSEFKNVDPDTQEEINDIMMMMYKSGNVCSVPHPPENCYLIPRDSLNGSQFNPFSVVIGGGKIDFEMKKESNNITVRYINVDLLASGPPDAMFDENASSSTEGNSLEDAWKFGSQGPEIYDYVLLGIPYNVSTINESQDMKINITKFYGDSFSSAEWEQEVNSTGELTEDYVDYNSGDYVSYINGTGILCNSSDENLSSGLCYKDTELNLLWFKIPHFSGIGPNVVGSAIETPPGDSNPPSGGSSNNDDEEEEVVTYNITNEQITLGYTKALENGSVINFNINNENHTVTIERIGTLFVNVAINSVTQRATILVGEENKFELTGDTYYDLMVRLNSLDIVQNKASMTIKSINELIPEEQEAAPITGEITGEEDASPEETGGDEELITPAPKSNKIFKILVIPISLAFIAIMIIVILVHSKNRSRRHYELYDFY